jgi:hypothetical protein
MKNIGSFSLTRFVDANCYPQRLNTLSKNRKRWLDQSDRLTASGVM